MVFKRLANFEDIASGGQGRTQKKISGGLKYWGLKSGKREVRGFSTGKFFLIFYEITMF